MENIFKYFEFSEFITDSSSTFSGNEICYSILNEHHFLIFEKINESYNLYISKYDSEQQIGKQTPELINLLIANYNKSIPEHRVTLRKYLE